MLRTVLLSILVCSFALQTQAAEIEMLTDNEEGCTARLVGEIEAGDAAKLSNLMNGGKKLCLESPGGDFLEGLEIANSLNAMGITTILEENAECLSACALAFLGGSASYYTLDYPLSYPPSRYMHFTSTLGFHAPYLESDLEYFTSAQLTSAFKTAIQATALMVSSSDKYGVPVDATLRFLEAPENSYYFVDSVLRAHELNIGILGGDKISLKEIEEDSLYILCENFSSNINGMKSLGGYFYETSLIAEYILELSPVQKALLILTTSEGQYFVQGCMIEIDDSSGDLKIYEIWTELLLDEIQGFCTDIEGARDYFKYSDVKGKRIRCPWENFVFNKLRKSFSEVASINTRLDNYYLHGEKKFSDLLEITTTVARINASELRSVFINYDADTRAYLQRALRRLGLYSSSMDGKWGEGTEGAFQKLFDTMDEYYPDLKWRQDFGFDDDEVSVDDFVDFWNAAVGCGEDKMLKITNLCQ